MYARHGAVRLRRMQSLSSTRHARELLVERRDVGFVHRLGGRAAVLVGSGFGVDEGYHFLHICWLFVTTDWVYGKAISR